LKEMKNIIKTILLASIFINGGFTNVNAQQKFGCDFYDENPDLKVGRLDTIAVTKAEEAIVDSVINQIVRVVGLKRNFIIKASNKVLYARAYSQVNNNYGEDRVIYYNPSIAKSLRNDTGYNWKLIGILAHEIGHHLNGHIQQNAKPNPTLEIEADEFAGFVINLLEGSLTQALEAVNAIPKDEATSTHPSKADRMMFVIKGWQNSQAKTKSIVRTDTLKVYYTPSTKKRIITKYSYGINIGTAVVNPYDGGMRWNESLLKSNKLINTMNISLYGDYNIAKSIFNAFGALQIGNASGNNYIAGTSHLGYAGSPYVTAGYSGSEVVHNYLTNYQELQLGIIARSKTIKQFNFALAIGGSIGNFSTHINALNATNTIYDYNRINLLSKQEAIDYLKGTLDNTYETKAESKAGSTASSIYLGAFVLPRLEYNVTKKIAINLQYQFTQTNTGYLDAFNWQEPILDVPNATLISTQIPTKDNMRVWSVGVSFKELSSVNK
jgi:hypothetical protein